MTTPDPIQLAAWLGCLVFVLGLFNQGSKALFTLRGKPSPAETQAATSALTERIARIETCMIASKLDQDRRLAAMEEAHLTMRDHIGREIDKVYNRVNATADATATMTGELRVIMTQLNRLLTRD